MKTILIVGVFDYPDIPEAHRIIQHVIKEERCHLVYDDHLPSGPCDEILLFCAHWSETPTEILLAARERNIPTSLFIHTKEEL